MLLDRGVLDTVLRLKACGHTVMIRVILERSPTKPPRMGLRLKPAPVDLEVLHSATSLAKERVHAL